ncbi:histidine phosphatase family protein [Calidifontibacter terrae]
MIDPTRLLIARHGDAEYPVHGVITDDGGWLTDKGRGQVANLATSLAASEIRVIFTSTMNRAQQSGEIAAQILQVPVHHVEGLQEYAAGDFQGLPYGDPKAQAVFGAWLDGDLKRGFPGGETGEQVVTRYREALDDVADRVGAHRALVFSHGGVMSLAIPRLSRNVRDDLAKERFLPNCVPAEVDVVRDNWQVVSWPGSTDKSSV